ncbi:MAG: ATP-binding protein, partial [Methyloceanibacter sp.]
VKGKDEFAELGKSFNNMASDLQEHQKALQEARDNLETVVEERTEELRLANESLRKIDETRRAFFADISHELRTPLTVIRGEGEIALRGRNKRVAEYKHSIERIVEQAKHLSVLVGDLLFIARQGAGAAKLKIKPVDLTDLVESVVDDAKVIATNKDVGIEFTDDAPHKAIDGDPARLRQLLLILLDNAVRYSNSKGKVDVGLSRKNGVVEVEVSDTGVGIPSEDMDSIFERFRRAGNAAEANEEGLGLGLPVARAIVQAHGGNIDVKSQVGKGTSVLVTLPEELGGSQA